MSDTGNETKGFDANTLITGVISILSAIAAILCVACPMWNLICKIVAQFFTSLAVAFHLDGKKDSSMKWDAIFAFAVSILAGLTTIFSSYINTTLIFPNADQNQIFVDTLKMCSGLLSVIGVVLHLDNPLTDKKAGM